MSDEHPASRPESEFDRERGTFCDAHDKFRTPDPALRSGTALYRTPRALEKRRRPPHLARVSTWRSSSRGDRRRISTDPGPRAAGRTRQKSCHAHDKIAARIRVSVVAEMIATAPGSLRAGSVTTSPL